VHVVNRFPPFPISLTASSSFCRPDKGLEKSQSVADKNNRPKDVFGRPLPTEQEFEVLKNAPRYFASSLFRQLFQQPCNMKHKISNVHSF
jgi:hypothetical protein